MSYVCNKRRRGPGNAGISSIEFALVASAFMLLLIGVFDIARYLYTVQALETLTITLGRTYLLPQPGSPDGTPVCPTYSGDALSAVVPALLDPGLLTVNTLSCTWGNGVTSAIVTVQYPFTATFLVLLNGTLTQTATYNY